MLLAFMDVGMLKFLFVAVFVFEGNQSNIYSVRPTVTEAFNICFFSETVQARDLSECNAHRADA